MLEFTSIIFDFIDTVRRIVRSSWLWGLGWLFQPLSGSHRNWLCEELID
jgi:hypothetical protein